jgi:hypothetical protein
MSVAIVHQQVSGRQATEYSARAYSLPISSPFKIFRRKVGFQLLLGTRPYELVGRPDVCFWVKSRRPKEIRTSNF